PSPAWKYASSLETACRVMVRALTRRTQPGDGTMNVVETITDKQRAIDALRALPDHATLEDAIERLCFIAKIEQGLRQSDAGELVSHDEVKKQFSWRQRIAWSSSLNPVGPFRNLKILWCVKSFTRRIESSTGSWVSIRSTYSRC